MVRRGGGFSSLNMKVIFDGGAASLKCSLVIGNMVLSLFDVGANERQCKGFSL